MKIGVVSDTHSRELPKSMMEDLAKTDLIIHAGDFCSFKDYQAFSKLKEIKAVYGNMDEPQLRRVLPRRQIFQCESVKIGLFHGEGPPQKLLEVMQKEFQGEKVDVIIFGHSHQALNQKINGALYFNPGSPNDTIFAPYCSYGILEINKNKIDAKIIKLK